MRLRNQYNGVQAVVPDEKAQRLIAEGTYEAVPADEQLSKRESEELDRAAAEARSAARKRDGKTSIGAAISASVPENEYA